MFNPSTTSTKKIAQRASAFACAIAAVVLVSGQANAASHCIPVAGTFDINPVSPADCTSPVGVCGKGNFKGVLRGDYISPFTSIVPTADTPTTGVILFTADNTLHARLAGLSGDITFKEGGAFKTTGDGEFSELFSIVGGTSGFANATGQIYGNGTVVNGAGNGAYVGKVCLP